MPVLDLFSGQGCSNVNLQLCRACILISMTVIVCVQASISTYAFNCWRAQWCTEEGEGPVLSKDQAHREFHVYGGM